MLSIIVRRLLGAVPILVIVSLITFAMIHMIPGDPAEAIAGM
ncbi:MAG: glutathione ABC transporter permease GsiC, partial [Acetobacteraceae bacterium]